MSVSVKRTAWVDIAKGLSIFLVVMMYAAASVGEDTGGVSVLHWVIAFAKPMRMPEFFLLSGLFLSRVIDRSWASFADRRVVHYFYFYILWATIHIVLKIALLSMDPLGAAEQLAWAIVQPYGVLWFIYMLAIVSVVTKLLHSLHTPHWLTFLIAALLQITPIHTGSYLIDQFCQYFVFFFAGYALAPFIFRLAEWTRSNTRKAIAGLAIWAVVEAALVFSPGFVMHPVEPQLGYADLPGVLLALGLSGSVALCTIAALLSRLSCMDWLRWTGSKSLIIYTAFVLPLGMSRTIFIKLGLLDPNFLSLGSMAIAIISPLILYCIIQRLNIGLFLFARPNWVHIAVPAIKGKRLPPL